MCHYFYFTKHSTSETATISTILYDTLVHTCCVHEGTVEVEGEQRLLEVPQEVLQEAGDGVDIVHLAEDGNRFATEKLLLQLLHCAISAGQTVQSSLRGNKHSNSPSTVSFT